MAMFFDWMIHRSVATLLRLLETAEYFNPQDYNRVFEGELEKILARIQNPEIRQQVAALRGLDWAGYIVRSLARAGFRDDDQQEAFHQIAIKLLVEPGRLFSGWEPSRHGPLERRFRRSVWNAIRNISDKTRNHRKWMVSADPIVMGQYAGREPNTSLIDEFRQLVGQRLGNLALAILDARLSGEETKNLVGKVEFGMPSAFYIRREVRSIKELAQRFASASGDPSFSEMVTRAMNAEAKTVSRRKSATAARQAG